MHKCIRVIDIETGPEPLDGEPGIVEIGFCDLISQNADLLGAPTDWTVVGGTARLVNPGRPIPPETSAVHHIIDADVAASKSWRDVAAPLFGLNSNLQWGAPIIAFAAHSAEFEQSRISKDLTGDIPWICTHKAALRLWPDAPSHSNNAIRYLLNPQGLDRQAAQPTHRAYPDAYVTAFTLREALNAGHSVEQLVKWTTEPVLLSRCKIGKWRGDDGRGTPWAEVDSGMLHWLLDKDFDENVLFTARYHLEQREIDQRLENERIDMERQFRDNGFHEPPPMELPPLSAYENQEMLPL